MRPQHELIDRTLTGLARHIGPTRMLRLLKSLASDETNNFRVAEEFSIAPYFVGLLRDRLVYCMLWMFQQFEMDQILRPGSFQKLEHQEHRLTDRRIFPN